MPRGCSPLNTASPSTRPRRNARCSTPLPRRPRGANSLSAPPVQAPLARTQRRLGATRPHRRPVLSHPSTHTCELSASASPTRPSPTCAGALLPHAGPTAKRRPTPRRTCTSLRGISPDSSQKSFALASSPCATRDHPAGRCGAPIPLFAEASSLDERQRGKPYGRLQPSSRSHPIPSF